MKRQRIICVQNEKTKNNLCRKWKEKEKSVYEMTSARNKYILLGLVGGSLGKRMHQRGQEETFEPPYLET